MKGETGRPDGRGPGGAGREDGGGRGGGNLEGRGKRSGAGGGLPNAGLGGKEPFARLFVGTYTEAGAGTGACDGTSAPESGPSGARGIYSLSLDLESGFVSADHTVMSNPNPSFLARRGRLLIAAHEVAGKAKAAVYAAHDDGSIEHISTVADTSGAGCCHVAVHPNGRWVYGSNYESGTLSCWPLRLDGSLGPLHASALHQGSGPNLCRQKGPHAHAACFVGMSNEADGNPVLAVADLGIDGIVLYEAPASTGLMASPFAVIRTPAGFGPRMMATRPGHPGQLAVVGELANSMIIYDTKPSASAGSPVACAWRELARFDLPSCCGIRTLAAHAQFSPCGRWLYVSIREKDVIAVYELDSDGQVIAQARFACAGSWPRHFSLSPCGGYLAVANQKSNEVVVFQTPKPGDSEMREIGRAEIPSPTCVIWS